MTQRFLVLLAGLVVASWVHAQEPSAPANEILHAILLPRISGELRREGVPEEEVRIAIQDAIRRRIPPAETKELFEESARAVRERGPIHNFGAFVQAQLDAGLRGRDLAAAIRAEHERRGIGKGRKLENRGKGRRDVGQGRQTVDQRPAAGEGTDSVRAKAPEAAKGRVRPGGQRGARRDTTPQGGGLP